MKNLAMCFCLLSIFLLTSLGAHASLIKWDFTAVIDDQTGSGDPLGVDGDSIAMSFLIDESAAWQDSGGNLFIPTSSASVSISGHDVSWATSPTAGSFSAGIFGWVDGIGSGNFVDLVIDDTTVVTTAFINVIPTVIPTVGDTIITDHLPTAQTFSGFDWSGNNLEDHQYLNVSTTVTAGVPEPAIIALFGIGLAGLGWSRRKKA